MVIPYWRIDGSALWQGHVLDVLLKWAEQREEEAEPEAVQMGLL